MFTLKNKYYRRSHISEGVFRHFLRCFALDLNAYETSQLVGLSHKSCRLLYGKLRHRLAELAVEEARQTMGEFECDESYFGPARVRGKRGRGAAGKTPVFGLLKRDGHVFVQVVDNCSQSRAHADYSRPSA